MAARKADSLTATCEPIVYKMSEPRRMQPYGSLWTVTGIAFTLIYLFIHIYRFGKSKDIYIPLPPGRNIFAVLISSNSSN
jgi:hypothetical protein